MSHLRAFLLLASLLAGVSPAASIPDKDIRAALIGSWVNPPGSLERFPLSARQIFRNNGTAVLYVYQTPECKVPAAQFEVTWSVTEGVLTTRVTRSTHPAWVPVGDVSRVAVVDVKPNRVVFETDDRTFIREKSETCYAPDARET